MSKHPPCPGSGMEPELAHTCPACGENFMRSDAPLRVFCAKVIPHHRPRCRYLFGSRRRCSNTAIDGEMCQIHQGADQ